MALHTIQELKIRQALPLDVKIRMTEQRIREFVSEFGVDGCYLSFSGGKDSTALLHIARSIYPDLPAVFVDTGLEYPEIRDFVRMKETHPKQYDYIMRSADQGGLNYKEIIEWMNEHGDLHIQI